MLNFGGVLEGGHVTRIQWKVRPGFFVAQMIFRVQTIIQTSKLQWFVMVMTAVECTQAYNIGSVGSMCQRKNGGTLGMVPLIINPIYTSHSGYLFFQGLLAEIQQLGAHHLKGFPTIFPMNVWILLDKFQPSNCIPSPSCRGAILKPLRDVARHPNWKVHVYLGSYEGNTILVPPTKGSNMLLWKSQSFI